MAFGGMALGEMENASPIPIEELLAHSSWLSRLAKSLVFEESEADELVQETWLAAIRNPPDRSGPARPWLSRVLRNCLRMRRRGEGRRTERETNSDEPTAEPTPDRWAEKLELQRELTGLVQQVREPARTAILMRYYEDLSAADIARRLGLPASTVRSRISLGLGELRSMLAAKSNGDKRAWQLALAPLILPDTAPAAGSSSSVTTSSALAKACLVAAVVAMLGAAAWFFQGRSDSLAATPSEDSEQTETAPSAQLAAIDGITTAQEENLVEPPANAIRLEGQVLDLDGEPLAGVQIRASGLAPEGGLYFDWATVRSGDDGSFVFEILEPSTYDLSAELDGLVGGLVDYTLSDKSEPAIIWLAPSSELEVQLVDKTTGDPIVGAWVALGEDFHLTDEQGGFVFTGLAGGYHGLHVRADGYGRSNRSVQMPTSGHTTRVERFDLVRGVSVSGRIVPPDDMPKWSWSWSHGYVVARDVSRTRAVNSALAEGVYVQEDKTFTIDAVPPGTYQFTFYPLTVDNRGNRTVSYGTSELIEITDRALKGVQIPVTIKKGAEPWVMKHPPGEGEPDEGRIRVTGVVLDTSDKPVRSVSVTAVSTSSGKLWRSWAADEDGGFRMDLPDEDVKMIATDLSGLESDPITVVPSSGKKIQLRLPDAPPDGAITGLVVDAQGEPVPEVQVMAQRTDVLTWRRPILRTQTDGAGRFRLTGLPGEDYDIVASRRLRRDVRAGMSVRVGDDVRYTLEQAGSIRGRALLEGGASLTSLVMLVGTDPAPIDVHPDEDGLFEVTGLSSGDYDLILRGPQFAEQVVKAVHITPRQATDLGTIRLSQPAVAGVVIDGQGRPIAGATVAFSRHGISDGKHVVAGFSGLAAKRSTKTDSTGAFELHGIGAGYVAATHPRAGRSLAVPVNAEDEMVELQLRQVARLAGQVIQDGSPVYDAEVHAQAGATRIVVRTGHDGRYIIEEIPAGNYAVTVALGRNPLAEHRITIDASVAVGATTQLDIDVPARGDTTLTVELRGRGESVPLVSLEALDTDAQSERVIDFAITDTVVFQRLQPGSYRLCTALAVAADHGDTLYRVEEALADSHCEPVEVSGASTRAVAVVQSQ